MTRPEFQDYMRNESRCFTYSYISSNVRVSVSKSFLDNKNKGGVLMFLHSGSFFLSGAALILTHKIGYTAVASVHNLQYLSRQERDFWLEVHSNANNHYSRQMFLTTHNKRDIINWLAESNFLGVAPDVNELGKKQKTSKCKSQYGDLYLQTSPARIARAANKPLYPMTIVYNTFEDMHNLYVGDACYGADIDMMMQLALDDILSNVKGNEYQMFHDLKSHFGTPY